MSYNEFYIAIWLHNSLRFSPSAWIVYKHFHDTAPLREFDKVNRSMARDVTGQNRWVRGALSNRTVICSAHKHTIYFLNKCLDFQTSFHWKADNTFFQRQSCENKHPYHYSSWLITDILFWSDFAVVFERGSWHTPRRQPGSKRIQSTFTRVRLIESPQWIWSTTIIIWQFPSWGVFDRIYVS